LFDFLSGLFGFHLARLDYSLSRHEERSLCGEVLRDVRECLPERIRRVDQDGAGAGGVWQVAGVDWRQGGSLQGPEVWLSSFVFWVELVSVSFHFISFHFVSFHFISFHFFFFFFFEFD
jgi:hypothetical protein